ncbi:MAG: autotransporter outer membrane beta-barrel domain-containing protein, partial [Acidaminococcaceae bacterium]|nr:autotransporter outer membrane beta-barrel domain-containing protein [Acidaminococcaceae bacterium]
MEMQKKEVVLSKKIVAGLMAGTLLGSVIYVQPVAAAKVPITIATQNDYDNYTDDTGNTGKDSDGNIIVNDDTGGYNINIGADGGTGPEFLGQASGAKAGVEAKGSNNELILKGGELGSLKVGGSGEIKDNKITVNGGTVMNVGVEVECNDGAVITGNTVAVTAGQVEKSVVGGGNIANTTEKDEISGNTVNISGGEIVMVTGGSSNSSNAAGSVSGNTVNISGGKITDTVIGGFSAGAAVSNNTVNISDGDIAQAYGGVLGDTVTSGTISGNGVSISGNDTKVGMVLGALGAGSDMVIQGNFVEISGGTIGVDGVYGVITGDSGTVTNNRVTITGGTIEGSVIGVGNSNTSSAADVSGNSVTITAGKVANDVLGAGSGTGTVSGNSVTISGGEVTGEKVLGGASESGVAMNNTVEISGGTISSDVIGGAASTGAVSGNSVVITGGSIGRNVMGGQGNSSSTTAAVSGNSVTVKGGTIGSFVVGGMAVSGSSSVSGNSITISGGSMGISGYAACGGIGSGDVSNNNVTISGGTLTGNVYGGYSTGTGAVTGNSVTISGAPTFIDTVIYGGESVGGGEVSGNILNIKNTGITVANVKNFAVYNFYLPDTVQANDTLLMLNGGTGHEGTDISGSAVNVGVAGSAPALQVGDNINIMVNNNGITADGVTYGVQQGVSIAYGFETALSVDGKKVVATVSKVPERTLEQSQSPVETLLASVSFINSGADLLAGRGLADLADTAVGGTEIFGAMSGGSMRYDTGSHADVKGYNFALGMGKAVANNAGKLTFGPFMEYGYGDYTSYLDNGIRGDGKTKYYGIGLLARQDNKSGLYYEGSLRYGRMDADYASGDMTGVGGSKVFADYDSSSSYYGAHLGIGKVNKINDTTKTDLYAKLFYTHQGGDSVTLGGEGTG